MAVADHVVTDLPYADRAHDGRGGASYGGYMIDWMLGHTQRFKALISHDGVYDLASVFGATEEIVVPALGVRRHPVGQAGGLRQMVAEPFRARTSRRPRW